MISYADMEIARVVHAANTALQTVLGDESPSSYVLDNEDAALIASVVNGVREARNGCTPEGMWQSWKEFKQSQGWVYGPEKDPVKKTHPCLVGKYTDLAQEVRDKDVLFLAIVRALTVRA